jgi:hypothetical protein
MKAWVNTHEVNRRRTDARLCAGRFCITCAVGLLASSALCFAEPVGDEDDHFDGLLIPLDEIALELSNPVTGLRSFAVDYEYRTYQGDLPDANSQNSYRVVFTPSWPIRLSNGKNLLLRARLSADGDQPQWNPASYLTWEEFLIRQAPAAGSEADSRWTLDPATGGFSYGHGNMGDLSVEVGYGGVNDDGGISAVGLVNVANTNEDKSARRGQWLIGPEIVLGRVTGWGIYGARAKHLTNIAGEGEQEIDFDTNETTLKLFFAYSLGNGWQIESNPVILYDWEAASGNEWYVPVAAGISKTMRVGRTPVKLGIEVQHFVVSPERFGQEWLVRFNFTPVFSTRLLR